MPLQLQDLLNYVLQLDAGDRQQAALDLQTQQQHLGNLNTFVGLLGRVQNPQQLGELKSFFAQNGVPSATLDQVASAYVPTLQQQLEQLNAQGMAAMSPTQHAAVANESAVRNATGETSADVASNQALSQSFADPGIFDQKARRGQLFSRIGYDPGRAAMSDAVAGLDAATLRRQAEIAGGTGLSDANIQDFLLRRTEIEGQLSLGLKHFNEGVFESDRNYGLALGREAADEQLQQAQAAALRAKADRGDPEALKELRTMLEDASKPNSPASQNLLKQMIENQAGGMVDAKGRRLFTLPKTDTYTPNFWEKHF